LKVKKHCYSGDKISESYGFGRKRKTTLDLKYQMLEIARGEKTGAAPTGSPIGIWGNDQVFRKR
jgi:hypothetical protein